MEKALLKVDELTVAFKQETVVDKVSFEIRQGETFALVGESGSGKSITALSVIRLLPSNAQVHVKQMHLGGENLLNITEQNFCRIRGNKVGLIFQDPMSSLNPVMTVGEQIAEVLKIHHQYSETELDQAVLTLLQQVEIPDAGRRMKVYPHQLSGGQRQRVMIAIALAASPDLLIADEPTTALDVTVQAQILALLKSIQKKTGMALWIISHDLALVSTIADRVAVMHRGVLVEQGSSDVFFQEASHPYSLKLLDALPSIRNCQRENVIKPSDDVMLQVDGLKIYYPIRKGFFKRIVDYVKAVDDVSFQLKTAETLALVGESGCGKTSLGKGLLNLIPLTSGSVMIDKTELSGLNRQQLRQLRSDIQIVFQDPFASMNPRMLVADIIMEGHKALYPEICSAERQAKIATLLRQVELPEDSALRYPHEFSGGQRQRICIARALAVEPKLIVCDEPTSALDVSVQAQILRLLKQLQQDQGLSYLFITHDLAVVAEIADQVAVMHQGKIVEKGDVEQVLTRPVHDYTRTLLSAVPEIGTRTSQAG